MPANNGNLQYIPITKLLFDPKNPRLPSSVNGENERAVLDWMLKEGTIIELMSSIGEQDYFPGEPLLAVPSKKNGFYEVIEGNRRLAAIKLLHNPELATRKGRSTKVVSEEAKHKPDTLPALVYKKREDILDYLGYRHITGIKEWDPLAKARYLSQLQQKFLNLPAGEQYKSLARIIGSRADYVARMLTGYSAYEYMKDENFFDIPDLIEDTLDFSVLTTALNYSNIAEFVGLEHRGDATLANIDRSNLKLLMSWMFEKNSEGMTKLGESRDLKNLSAIVSSPRALEAFIDGASLERAYLLTEEPSLLFSKSINEAKARLMDAHENSYLVDEPLKSDSDMLFDVMKLARDLKSIVDTKLFALEPTS